MEKEPRHMLVEKRQQIEKEIEHLINATGSLLRPLRSLKEDQLAAVVIYSLMIQGIIQIQSSSAKLRDGLLKRFKDQISLVSPILGESIDRATIFMACFDEMVACGSAQKKCEDDGIPEADCPDAIEACGQEAHCIFGQIEKMKGIIEDILGRLKPPQPPPWPSIK